MLTAAGRGRADNEDQCVFAAPGDPAAERAGIGYLFAVVGGNAHAGKGLRAGRETAASLREILEDDRALQLRPDLLTHYLHAADQRLSRFIGGRATVTTVWIWEERGDDGVQVAWAHVGDTRLYRQRDGAWHQVTRDHAVGRLLDRAIGGGAGLEIDTGRFVARPGERLVLLSDGVWRGARPGTALGGARFPGTAEAARQLVGQARLNGGADDTSALVITVREIDADPEPEH